MILRNLIWWQEEATATTAEWGEIKGWEEDNGTDDIKDSS